ncbi:hypothetical protein FRC01_003381 [Tulasnella sp. 417]|nr:hypothetical protein FRC01_003381 [Tulasnella sp. 417]
MSSNEEQPVGLNRFDDDESDDDYDPAHDQPSPSEDEDEASDSLQVDQEVEEESESDDDDGDGIQLDISALDPATAVDDRTRNTIVSLLRSYGYMLRGRAVEVAVESSEEDEQDPAQVLSRSLRHHRPDLFLRSVVGVLLKGDTEIAKSPYQEGLNFSKAGNLGEYTPSPARIPQTSHLSAKEFTASVSKLDFQVESKLTRTSYQPPMALSSPPTTPRLTSGNSQQVCPQLLDSSFYYTCCQDFDLRVYDMTAPITPLDATTASMHSDHHTSMRLTKTIHGLGSGWTITDSHLSPDNSALLYSSLDSTLYMVKTQDPDEEQTQLHLGRSAGNWGYDYRVAIFSCRFSSDGREVIAGGSGGYLFVYDLGKMRRTLGIKAHGDDINSCCWADTSSGNVLVSASDDTSLKVWDRRSLGASHTPSGVLIGHTEGITHVAPKGDGRYVISNGKDQVLRLWDLRKMRTHNEWKGANLYGHNGFDYR